MLHLLRRAVPKVGKELSVVHKVTAEKELVQFRGGKIQELQGLADRCRFGLFLFFFCSLSRKVADLDLPCREMAQLL